MPVLVDGFIVSAAALAAVRLNPSCAAWLIYSHRSMERGHRMVLDALGADPILDLKLRLGEGSGAAAALAGMLYTGMMQTARFNFGEGAELMAIAAVILGGTSLFGGKGTILGTFAGSLLIGTINNGLIIMGLDVSEQMMIAGAIIIVAVAFGKKPGQA
mgnify:CR=1 FL=1